MSDTLLDAANTNSLTGAMGSMMPGNPDVARGFRQGFGSVGKFGPIQAAQMVPEQWMDGGILASPVQRQNTRARIMAQLAGQQ